MLTRLIAALGLVSLSSSEDEVEYHPASCKNLEDGVQWVRPLTGKITSDFDNYPSIQVRCSDGYMILDYSLDSNIALYFSSFWIWTDDAASSSLTDRVTWTDWFLPYSEETQNMNFRLSQDCNQCQSSDEYDDFAAYFMTGNYIGCMWATKAYCDMDQQTLECYSCVTPASDNEMPGLCTHIELSANNEVYLNHDACVSSKWNAVPSIGLTGQYCTCVKPSDNDDDGELQFPALYKSGNSLNQITSKNEEEEEEGNDESLTSSSSETNLVELTSDNFKHGTYRITKAGTYKLMEDIELNMNPAENFDSPNAEANWWPSNDQSDEYPGADGSFVGAFSMGFFAGISVECDDVVIDLNGHTFAQSEYFYVQQRFFSLIELASKVFVSGQGPGNFGGTLQSGSNIIIKNGILGLTSHHSIHGNYATDIILKNLKIKDFEVAGIALNGFENVRIENIDVGPNYEKVPVTGLYTQGRFMLERLRAVEATGTSQTVTFANRITDEYTVSDVLNELELQMDMAFQYSFDLTSKYDFNDLTKFPSNDDLSRWKLSNRDFVNPRGLPVGATLYGIYLNSQGASVFGLGQAPGHSSTAVLKDIKIHNLRNEPWETVRYRLNRGPFNDLVDMVSISDNGLSDITTAKYVGSAYSDAQVALNVFSDDWGVLGHSLLTSKVSQWIFNNVNKLDETDPMYCNSDLMLHVTKGIFGLRVDSVLDVDISNIEISNLHNLGFFGNDKLCGNYWKSGNGGHHNQNYPLQTGYTGTEVHGMTMIRSSGKVNNIIINDVLSARGDAHGFQLFPGNEVEIGDINIENIHAGVYVSDDDFNEPYLPNKVPRACAFDMWAFYDESNYLDENSVTFMDNTNIYASCITRHSDSCSFDFEYIKNVLSDSDDDDDDFVDVSGNGYNFEYATDIGECSSDVSSSLDNSNILTVLSETSDFHKESLNYLQHQTQYGMKSSIDINGINVETFVINDDNNNNDNNDDNKEESEGIDSIVDKDNTETKSKTESKSKSKSSSSGSGSKSNSKSKSSSSSSKTSVGGDVVGDNEEKFDSYPEEWPSNESLSLMAWLLVVFLIITIILVLSCIIYQKFATYDLHRSIVGNEKESNEFSFEAFLKQGRHNSKGSNNANYINPLSNQNFMGIHEKVYLMDENDQENTPLIGR